MMGSFMPADADADYDKMKRDYNPGDYKIE